MRISKYLNLLHWLEEYPITANFIVFSVDACCAYIYWPNPISVMLGGAGMGISTMGIIIIYLMRKDMLRTSWE